MPLERVYQSKIFAQARTIEADTFDILKESLEKVRANQIVDFGCGYGEMAAKLYQAGFNVTGVDPSLIAIDQAKHRFPHIAFKLGTAENPPSLEHDIDAAYFLNSLHHVPIPAMRQAVIAALDIVKSGGILLVVEPMAAGSFFRAMKPIEDESEIRTFAVRVVEDLISDGTVKLLDLRRWDRESAFASLEDFKDYLLRVDPERQIALDQNGAQLAKAWRENIALRNGKAYLKQPLVCWTLARR